MSADPARAEAVIDLAAIRANVARLRELAAPAEAMVVVKADGYGHGMVPAARASRAAGATWLGVAVLEEALALRRAGDTGRILTWLAVPGESYGDAITAEVDVTASSRWQLDDIVASARRAERTARLQLKVDSGLSRNGATLEEWPLLVRAALAARDAGDVEVTGVWSHLACADEPDHPANDMQERQFRQALEVARSEGLRPGLCHLANSAGALTRPSARLDLIRAGLAAYGLSPIPDIADPAQLGLQPAMTVRGRLAAVKRVPAGSGVSYGHIYATPAATTLGLVPLGYADGVPRSTSNRAQVALGGARAPLVGHVCMDQFVIDLGDRQAAAGDEVVLFGPGDGGEPTAQEWAEAAGTISYEIVSRLGPRVRLTHIGAAP